MFTKTLTLPSLANASLSKYDDSEGTQPPSSINVARDHYDTKLTAAIQPANAACILGDDWSSVW